MQFLKTLFWIAIAVVIALFAIRNGAPVTVNLWSDLQMVTPLWVIVVFAFLAGLLPMLTIHRAARWRWRRRIEQERALAAPHAGADAPASQPHPAFQRTEADLPPGPSATPTGI